MNFQGSLLVLKYSKIFAIESTESICSIEGVVKCNQMGCSLTLIWGLCHGRDRMVVGFITTYAIRSYHH